MHTKILEVFGYQKIYPSHYKAHLKLNLYISLTKLHAKHGSQKTTYVNQSLSITSSSKKMISKPKYFTMIELFERDVPPKTMNLNLLMMKTSA